MEPYITAEMAATMKDSQNPRQKSQSKAFATIVHLQWDIMKERIPHLSITVIIKLTRQVVNATVKTKSSNILLIVYIALVLLV